MAQSFSVTETGALARTDEGVRRRVLVTGAAGRIGSYFAEHSHEKYDLVLMVHPDDDPGPIKEFGAIIEGDITDLDRMKEVCVGIDTVVHLAADPSPAAVWAVLLNLNIIGTYNTYVAAKAAGCRRAIYASSIHAVSGYPADVQVKTSDPVNPGDMYGVSKCFGEAMGRYMAEQEGLSVIALRIGAFQSLDEARKETSVGMIDSFVSERDLSQLINRSIDIENVRFAILNGSSNNRFKRLDISDARELVGYDPQDDLTQENPLLKELELGRVVPSHNTADDKENSGLREDL